MLYDKKTFVEEGEVLELFEDSVFRNSTFLMPTINGGHVTSIFLESTFSNIDWYWGTFNDSRFVTCTFKNCTFRGTAFLSCCFVECNFDSCRFAHDNVGGQCSFDDSRWYGCEARNCEGLDGVIRAGAE